MIRVLTLIATAWVGLSCAQAEPFWVSWTGDDYPENQGWTRYASAPPPSRWLSDGSLFIDSRADWWLYEHYIQYPRGLLPPGPREMFIARWRVRIVEVYVYDDPGVFENFGRGEILLSFSYQTVYSTFELDKEAVLNPTGEFHDFEIRSEDMLSYTLYADGAQAFDGIFWQGPPVVAAVGWRDVTSHRSLSQWEYFEFGITNAPQLGDVNCDGAINAFDIDPFVHALTRFEQFYLTIPDCDPMLADINGDGEVNVFDIDPFVELLVGSEAEE